MFLSLQGLLLNSQWVNEITFRAELKPVAVKKWAKEWRKFVYCLKYSGTVIWPFVTKLSFTRRLSVTNFWYEFYGSPTDVLVSDATLQTDGQTLPPHKALSTPQRTPNNFSFESVMATTMKIAVFGVIRSAFSYRRRFGDTAPTFRVEE
jgi:hypothetical protein